MDRNVVILMVVLSILVVRGESRASLIRPLLKLVKTGDSKHFVPQTAPSPSPDPSVVANSSRDGGGGKDEVPPAPPMSEGISSVTAERCVISSSEWCRDSKNLTACLPYAGSGPKGSYVIIQNDEGNSLNVNLTIFPSNFTLEAIKLEKHQAKRVQINNSALVGVIQSIVVNAGNGDCIIQAESPAPEDDSIGQDPSGAASVNLTQGVYLLVLIVLITGGAWACGKWGKQGRHLDGVPYRELEMGLPESFSAVNVETAGGWDQDWDDEWDEDNSVKSPNGKQLRNGHTNGLASRFSNSDEWGNESNDWDD